MLQCHARTGVVTCPRSCIPPCRNARDVAPSLSSWAALALPVLRAAERARTRFTPNQHMHFINNIV